MGSDDFLPVTITLLLEGEGLVAHLTDSRTVACFSRLETTAHFLEEIRKTARSLASAGSGDSSDSLSRMQRLDAVHQLGSTIYVRLLPEHIRQALSQCSFRILNLQLSPGLLGVPWELAFDGHEFLGDKCQVARQVVLGEIPPSRNRVASRSLRNVVLICDDGEPAGYVVRLQRSLQAIEGLLVERISAGQMNADDTLRRIATSDIVHYVGEANESAEGMAPMLGGAHAGISLRKIADAAPPALLFAEWTTAGDALFDAVERSLAVAACRNGFTLLTRPLRCDSDADLAFAIHLYRGLAEGAAVGEAVLRARQVRRSKAVPDPMHPAMTLYGDASLVLASRSDAGLGQDHRRQVTVLVYDLVESTRLMDSLGEETYSLLLKRYHERCGEIVAAYGGMSEPPQGDGIMCFFGVPVAREDSAAQALRAALRIVRSVVELGAGVRVGVATGEVVIRSGHPVGMTMHLAARLQSAAEPGTVLVSAETRRIVRDRFVFEELAWTPPLKGMDKPESVFRLLRETTNADADRADSAPRLVPLIGRERELRLIEKQWAAACTGRLRKILISGEAGIGKSRLLREFRHSLDSSRARVFELRGASDLASSAYYPLIELLRGLLGIENGSDNEDNLNRVESMLPAEGKSDGSVQLLATLIGVPYAPRYAPPAHTAEKARLRTLVLLVECLQREAAKTPVCLIVEDVQWIDPSTREVLQQLNEHGRRLPLLLLITERRDGRKRYRLGFRAYELRLKRLSRDATREMILRSCGEGTLPSSIVSSIVEKSDGVPLYIEESTRLTIERQALPARSDRSAGWSVPSTINDLLTARLDRVGGAKRVAGLGAVIGREFSRALLQAALEHGNAGTTRDLETSLAVLLESGLLVRKGSEKHETFYFKHALVREAAYHSLLQSDRIAFHRTIARVMETRFRDLAERQPELLAHHYTQAAMAIEALDGWERAARLAASRSALPEAIDHLTSALAVAARLPADPAREQIELRLQLLLAGQLIATEGYGAQRVEEAYARAADLCRSAGDDIALLKTQLGLEGYHFMRADFAKAQAIAEQAETLARRSGDPMRELQSQWAVANLCFHQGELASAVAQMDLCLEKYRKLGARRWVIQDPGVMCLCYSAWGKWELGFPDQALQRARRVVMLAEKANHKFSMAEAYGFGASVHHFRGENREALKYADRAIGICEESGFSVWLAHARLMRGRALAEQEDVERGVAEMKEAYGLWAATGAVVTVPFHLALRAEGLALAGRPAEGLALVQTAYDVICRYGERYYEAEVMRLMGELLLQVKQDNSGWDEAETWMRKAMECARQRQLRGLTLRSAISLARLMVVQGRFADAIGILKPEYDWFTEGRSTRDLRAARDLLEALLSPTIHA